MYLLKCVFEMCYEKAPYLTAFLFFFCSFYNWTTHSSTSNSSPNFEVVYDDPSGLRFRSKWDKKLLNVDPSVRLWLDVHCGVRRYGAFDVTSQRLQASIYNQNDSSAYVCVASGEKVRFLKESCVCELYANTNKID